MFSSFFRFKKRFGQSWLSAFKDEVISRLCIHTRLNHLPILTPPPKNYRNPNLYLIVGCYNSGTTLLRDILSDHPAVNCLPREGVKFTSVFPSLEKKGWKRMPLHHKSLWHSINCSPKSLAKRYFSQLRPMWRSHKGSIYIDKSITHSLRLPVFRDYFGDLPVIYIKRNGLAVAEGVQRRVYLKRTSEPMKTYNSRRYPLELCLHQWSIINHKIMKDLPLFSKTLNLSYEEFCESPYETLHKVCNFLHIDPSVYSVNNSNITTPKRTLLIHNNNKKSLDSLSADFIKSSKSLLSEHGY